MSITLVSALGQDAGGQRSSVPVQNAGQLGGNTSDVLVSSGLCSVSPRLHWGCQELVTYVAVTYVLSTA